MDSAFEEVPVRIGDGTYTLQVRRRDNYVNANALSKQAGPVFGKYIKLNSSIPFPLPFHLLREDDAARFRHALRPHDAVTLVGLRFGLRTGLRGSGFEPWTPDMPPMVVEKSGSKKDQTTWVHPFLARHVTAWLFPGLDASVCATFDSLRLRDGIRYANVPALPAPVETHVPPETQIVPWSTLGPQEPPQPGDVVTRDYVNGVHQDFIIEPPWIQRLPPPRAPATASTSVRAAHVPTTAVGHAMKFVESLVADDGTPLDIEIRADGYFNATKLFKKATITISDYLNRKDTWGDLLRMSSDHKVPTGVHKDPLDQRVKVSEWRSGDRGTAYDGHGWSGTNQAPCKTRSVGGGSAG